METFRPVGAEMCKLICKWPEQGNGSSFGNGRRRVQQIHLTWMCGAVKLAIVSFRALCYDSGDAFMHIETQT